VLELRVFGAARAVAEAAGCAFPGRGRQAVAAAGVGFMCGVGKLCERVGWGHEG
jgi:hypothetical protein